MRLFGKISNILKISRNVGCRASTYHPNSLLYGHLQAWQAGLDMLQCRFYAQKSGVFTLNGGTNMLRKRISFSGTPGIMKDENDNFFPVGVIHSSDGDKNGGLKVLVIPLNLVGADDHVLRNMVNSLRVVSQHAEEIEAFAEMVSHAEISELVERDETRSENDAALEEAVPTHDEVPDYFVPTEINKQDDFHFWEAYNNQSSDVDAVGIVAESGPILQEMVAQATGGKTVCGTSEGTSVQEMVNTAMNTSHVQYTNPSIQSQEPRASSMPITQPIPPHPSKNPMTIDEPDFDPQVLAEEPQTNFEQTNETVQEIYTVVPDGLEERLNQLAISSMQLAFEMDMTNIRDAIMRDASERNINFPEKNFADIDDPTISVSTNVEVDAGDSPEHTVPLSFNALIKGTVEIDTSKIAPETLDNLKIPEFNDNVTSIAANICSTALQRGFPPELNTKAYHTNSDELFGNARELCSADEGGKKETNNGKCPETPAVTAERRRIALQKCKALKRINPCAENQCVEFDEQAIAQDKSTMAVRAKKRSMCTSQTAISDTGDESTMRLKVEMRDGCKNPPMKPKKKCKKTCPLDDPCKEKECEKTPATKKDDKKKPSTKSIHTTRPITAKGKDNNKDGKGSKGKDGKKEDKDDDPCAKFRKEEKGKKDGCTEDDGGKKDDKCAKYKPKDKDPCADKKDCNGKDSGKDKDKDGKGKKATKEKVDDNGKDKKEDPCAKFKKAKEEDKCAKYKKDKKDDPCAKDGKDKGKNDKDGKGGKSKEGKDKKSKKAAKGDKDKDGEDPCDKFKKDKEGKGKDGKGKDGKGKDGKGKDGKDGKDPCEKFKKDKDGKGGKDGKGKDGKGKDGKDKDGKDKDGKDGKDPCEKFKKDKDGKGGKDGKGKDGKGKDGKSKDGKSKDGKDGKDPCEKFKKDKDGKGGKDGKGKDGKGKDGKGKDGKDKDGKDGKDPCEKFKKDKDKKGGKDGKSKDEKSKDGKGKDGKGKDGKDGKDPCEKFKKDKDGKGGKDGKGKDGKGKDGKGKDGKGKDGKGKDGKGKDGKDKEGKGDKDGKDGKDPCAKFKKDKDGKEDKGGKDKGGKDGKDKDKKGGKDEKDKDPCAKFKKDKDGKDKDGKDKNGKDKKSAKGKDGKGKDGKDGEDPCAKFKKDKDGKEKGGKDKKSPKGKDGKGKDGKGKDGKDGEDPCAKFKKDKDGKEKGGKKSAKGKDGKDKDGKDGKDPCDKFKKDKDGKDGKDGKGKDGKGKDGKGKDGKGKDGKGKDKKDKEGKGDKDKKDGKDPCAKFKKDKDGKEEKDGKDKKGAKGKDGKGGNDGKDGKDPCAKFKKDKDGKGGKDGKGDKDGKDGEDPCAKFKKDKDGKDKGGKDKKGKKDKKGGKDEDDPCAKFKKDKKGKEDNDDKKNKDKKDCSSNSSSPKIAKSDICLHKKIVATPGNYGTTPMKSFSTMALGHIFTEALPIRKQYVISNVLKPRFTTFSMRVVRNYGSKKKKGNAKCNAMGVKYPKNRKPDIKGRNEPKTDCYKDDENPCTEATCGGECKPLPKQRKKCERDEGPKENKFLNIVLASEPRRFISEVTRSKCPMSACASVPQQQADHCEQFQNQSEEILIPDSYTIQRIYRHMPVEKDYEVLIRTGSIAITGSDIHVYENGIKDCESITLGHDATGFVEKVGRCINHLRVGDRVVMEPALSCGICQFCKRGVYNMCAQLVYNGFFATHQIHPADLCHKLPDSISMEEGALTQTLALGCQACFKANIAPTTNVLVIGSCPTALAAALCANAIGAKNVIIASNMQPTLESIKNEFGFDYVHFDKNALFGEVLEGIYAKFKDWPNSVINCSISAMTMNLAVMALQPCGICVLAECESECASFNALDILMKNIRLVPSFRSTNMFPTALQMITSGRAPMYRFISNTYSWHSLEDAFKSAQHESNIGAKKVVVNCTNEDDFERKRRQ